MVTFSNKVYSKAKRYLLKSYLGLAIFRSLNRKKENFICPICSYHGPFVNVHPETGIRKHALCPKCGSAERHRLQYLVLRKIAVTYDLSKMSLIHFAPESFFQRYFRKVFGSYTSADLYNRNVDYKIDLRNIPFEDHSYDVVFASHVLEHIKEDTLAVSEISRILKPSGIAIIPVPIVAHETIEYPGPNLHDSGHVRVPGFDYYDRFSSFFGKIEKYNSKNFPEEYQLFLYEDRTLWPKTMPLRPIMQGTKHLDIVPVCYK